MNDVIWAAFYIAAKFYSLKVYVRANAMQLEMSFSLMFGYFHCGPDAFLLEQTAVISLTKGILLGVLGI